MTVERAESANGDARSPITDVSLSVSVSVPEEAVAEVLEGAPVGPWYDGPRWRARHVRGLRVASRQLPPAALLETLQEAVSVISPAWWAHAQRHGSTANVYLTLSPLDPESSWLVIPHPAVQLIAEVPASLDFDVLTEAAVVGVPAPKLVGAPAGAMEWDRVDEHALAGYVALIAERAPAGGRRQLGIDLPHRGGQAGVSLSNTILRVCCDAGVDVVVGVGLSGRFASGAGPA